MNQITKKTGIFFGIVLAFYYIVINTIVFFYDPTLFTKTSFGIFNMVFVLIIGVLCVWLAKRRSGNMITFKEGFSAYLLMICIGFIANQLSIYFLFNFINPEFKAINNQLMLDLALNNLKALELPESEIQEKMEVAKNIDNFAFKNLIFNLAGSILRGSIAGLLISLIFKNRSEFIDQKA